ncbi:MAG: hypothetical protein WDN04_09180 [Rhodospirillales bacterium]
MSLPANDGWGYIATFTHVIDTAANLADAAPGNMVQGADLVTLSGNAQISAAQAGLLASIPNFEAAAGQLTVLDGAAAIAGQQIAITSLGALAEINDSVTIGLAQADALATLADAGQLVFVGGHSFTVQGSYSQLTAGGNAAGVALAGHVIVADNASNLVLAAGHNWGAANPSYSLSESDTITAAEATTLAGLGTHFNEGAFSLQVTDSAGAVAAIAGALATLDATATVVDSAASISLHVGALVALGTALTAVTIDDAQPLGAAAAGAIAPLAPLLGQSVLLVADNATNMNANLVALDSIGGAIGTQLHLGITDSAANVGAHAAAFAGSGAALAVTLSDLAPITANVAAALAPLAGDFVNGNPGRRDRHRRHDRDRRGGARIGRRHRRHHYAVGRPDADRRGRGRPAAAG